jgi:hypothetical protein
MAFDVSWKGFGPRREEFDDEEGAMKFACSLLAVHAKDVELGAVNGVLDFRMLSGDELRWKCERRREPSRQT